jgi:hypothetical protein
MIIVELDSEYAELHSLLETNESIWFPVWVDSALHPKLNILSFIFIRVCDSDYIVINQHSDGIPIGMQRIIHLWRTGASKQLFGKKKLLHSLGETTSYTYDIDAYHFVKKGNIPTYTNIFESFLREARKHGVENWELDTIPIYKLSHAIQDVMQYSIPDTSVVANDVSYKWTNEIQIPILYQLEQPGLNINPTIFSRKYQLPHYKSHLSENNFLYTEYNPYHLTGRPSNRHGGINFAALKKSDSSRDMIISNGIFLQTDYDAYHLRIISKLIGYELPTTSAHQYFAEHYGCSYDESKGITFQLLYGGIPSEFYSIEFFKKTAEWIDLFWKKTVTLGGIKTQNRFIPLSLMSDPNPQKCFNYLLQSLETERNIDVLQKLLPYIKGTAVLRLYIYDAFLFDFEKRPDKEWVNGFMDILQHNGFPVKGSWGTNFGEI